MAALVECETMTPVDENLTAFLPNRDKYTNEELTTLGFHDVQATREDLLLSVVRIIKAQKITDDQLERLAYAEQCALVNC